MTPKEKADELIRKYYSIGAIEVKQCVLVAVNEIIKALGTVDKMYWQEVKQEIEKL